MGCANSKQAKMAVTPDAGFPPATIAARCAAPTAIMISDKSPEVRGDGKKIRDAFGI